MKELKISVIYGGSCPPQADPSMYNPDNYQANLQYFHDFLQRRGSSANTIDSYLTSVRHFHSLYRDVTVENLQSYKAWLMERYKPSTVNTRIYGINQYVAALQSGEVDWAEVVPVESLESLKSQGYQVKLNDYPHAWLYIMNTESGPFADARVRQAFSMSIDREGLCNDILQGVGTPLAQLMYPGSPWYAEGVEEYTYNPERAKELLAEAGYPDGFTTTFVCPTSGSGNMFPQIMNEYIQKCAEEVGIHIELDMSESERVWDVMKVGFKDEYADVGALNTSFYTMFPNVFQKFAGTGGSFNTGKYSNPEYDACIEAAYAATDEAESPSSSLKPRRFFTEELPWVIVCNDRNLRVLAPNVQNFAQSQTWYVDLTTVTVE